jgi:hypothetical protein
MRRDGENIIKTVMKFIIGTYSPVMKMKCKSRATSRRMATRDDNILLLCRISFALKRLLQVNMSSEWRGRISSSVYVVCYRMEKLW